MLRNRPQLKSLAALFLLGVLWVGSACHLRHHLVDPLCGTYGDHGSQPCARCAGLHSAAIATHPDVSAAPSAVAVAEVPSAHAVPPFVAVLIDGDPRAPPTA